MGLFDKATADDAKRKDDSKKPPKVKIATGPDRQYGDGGDDSSMAQKKKGLW